LGPPDCKDQAGPRPGEHERAMEALARKGMSVSITIDDIKARLMGQMREPRRRHVDYST